MDRIEREAEQAEESAKAKAHHASHKASGKANKAKETIKGKGKQAEAEAKKAGHSLQENRDNPVVIGNFVVWTAIAAGLG